MREDEIISRLEQINRRLGRLESMDLCGSGTKIMIFIMFVVFFLNGCNFK